jgi:broad specificity phosphatase PhoE
MTARVALIRHSTTAWNVERRLQGRADVPLSPEGKAALAGRQLPGAFADATVYSSPLARARQTAALLGYPEPIVEPRLVEMDWGAFEGRTVAELRAEIGAQMTADEALGLDFRPPNGESPRMMQQRIRPWLAEIAAAGKPAVAVTHKGIIRAVLALAYSWDMKGRQPVKLDWRCLHVFDLAADGTPRPGTFNVPLEST